MKKVVVLVLALVVAMGSMFAQELTKYERKTLFIFPVQYAPAATGEMNRDREVFVEKQLYKMFVADFKRVDFFDVNKGSLQSFLDNAAAFVRANVRDIAAQRMEADGKFKEAMVTADDLIKTLNHSYAAVPYIDSIEVQTKEKKVKNVKGETEVYTTYTYNMSMHFDIYSTETKEKIHTLKANNKTSIMGALMSGFGGFQVDNSDLKDLPREEREKQENFRSSVAGLFEIVKKDMRNTPEFTISAVVTMIGGGKFGFDYGKDSGIKIDHRYKTFTYTADGKMKMKSFGKVRKVDEAKSEAQILIGSAEEGDQAKEDGKLGLNITAGFGFTTIKWEDHYFHLINPSLPVVEVTNAMHPSLSIGVEYGLGPITNISELYFTMNGRMIMMKDEYDANVMGTDIVYEPEFSTYVIDAGVMKKFYLNRIGVNIGASVGYFMITNTFNYNPSMVWEYKGSGIGATIRGGAEFLVTPEIAVFGNLQYDIYSSPTNWELTVNGETVDLGIYSPSDLIDISASGIGFTAGLYFTF